MIDKTAMIAVTGRPNVGKSTLVNTLVGEKIAIVSDKPQTTRNRISGIVNRGSTQLILLDTPGYHKARTKLGEYMVRTAGGSVSGVDAAALLVEPVPEIGPQEKALFERFREEKVPVILVINKIDTVKKEALLRVISAYAEAYPFEAVVPVSAKTGDGMEDLLEELLKYAMDGPQLFPEDMVTDQPERQIVAEIVREKLLICLDREVPHGTAVEVTKFSERPDGLIDLDVTIYCEKDSHKGIIIGRNGAMLKKIGVLARTDIEQMLDTKVFLQTWVKVKENWRNSDVMIKNFGYTE